MSKYKLMDKLTIYKVDYSKELVYEEIPKGCSGVCSPEVNSKEECYIFKIEEITTEEYSLTDTLDYDGNIALKQGVNKQTVVNYYLTNNDKPINELYIDSYTNERNEESYQRYLTKTQTK